MLIWNTAGGLLLQAATVQVAMRMEGAVCLEANHDWLGILGLQIWLASRPKLELLQQAVSIDILWVNNGWNVLCTE